MKKTIKVLLFDDDIMVLRVLNKVLSRKGFEVATSKTAFDIFTTIAQHSPDIIIMDHDMPVVSGFEAIKQLKANEHTHLIPVIYFSSADGLAALAKEAGADSFVSKSSPTEHLTDRIESLIEA